MANFVKVASCADIPEGTGKTVEVGGKKIAVFNVGGAFYAIDNTCLHRGGPLGEGMLEGTTVTCPWHGWQYDCRTGQNVMSESFRVKSYTLENRGDELYGDLGD